MEGSFISNTKFTTLNSSSSSTTTIKFLCSYGGRILPRYPDGKLRYHGGETRVLSVDRSISFAELMVKLGEMCGTSMSLRCQLPTEDLDALVSITSDEDLANLIEEYDHRPASPPPSPSPGSIKIRAFLYPPKSAKKVSPTPSSASSSSNESLEFSFSTAASISSSSRCTMMSDRERSMRYMSRTPRFFPGLCYEKSAVPGKIPRSSYHGYGNASNTYLIHNGNHWQ